jgi:hypothetical protein
MTRREQQQLAIRLEIAWDKYVKLFGEVPHGTARQLVALVALLDDESKERCDEHTPYNEIRSEIDALTIQDGSLRDGPCSWDILLVRREEV